MLLTSGEKVLKSWKWASGNNFEEDDDEKNKKEAVKKEKYGEVASNSLVVTNKRLISCATRKSHGRNSDEFQTTYRDYPVRDIQDVYVSYKMEKFNTQPKSTKGLTILCITFAILGLLSMVVLGLLNEFVLGLCIFLVSSVIALACYAGIKKIKENSEEVKAPQCDLWIEFERVREGDRQVLSYGSKNIKIENKFELKVDVAVAKEIVESLGAVIIAAKEMK